MLSTNALRFSLEKVYYVIYDTNNKYTEKTNEKPKYNKN